VAGEVLLIFDGASSHLDANIANAANKYGITLYCLPSNTTHELQPMDRAVFKPFETFWDDEILLFFNRNKSSDVRKSDFGTIFSRVWTRAMTTRNIMSGFRATGIYPFDPHVIPEKAFAPSAVSEAKEERQPATSVIRNQNTAELNKRSLTPRNDGSLSDSSDTEDDDHSLSSLLATIPPKAQSTAKQKTSKSTENSPIQNDNASESDKPVTPPTPFSAFLSTPKRKSPQRITRKALNYRAQKIEASLFPDAKSVTNKMAKKTSKQKQKNRVKKMTSKEIRTTTEEVEDLSSTSKSWMCFICDEDRIENMSLCKFCLRYLHDKCGGITKNTNLSTYRCPECAE
jgi:hypothetical protein